MCKMGCMANRFCGVIIGLVNTAVMVGYFMGVVILEMQCKDGCYDGITLLVAVLAGPVVLYIIGYFLAWLSYQKGKGASSGCNFCCVMFWAIILVGLLGVMCFHAYEMIKLHTYEYSDIYGGMVCGNVAYAAVLCLILCNVMPIDEKPQGRADFSHIDDDQSQSDADATAV
mmetsp:Transcript_73843/g.66471  ORF Transcript_73843/g.66471 Transcript_73843/m.66471 type:complete len:171 (-) Transcript_73843:202-714(-)